MCTQITKRALHKRARRDVSALASDKSRLYKLFLPLGIAATGTTGTTEQPESPEQPDRIFGSTGTINQTGIGRADVTDASVPRGLRTGTGPPPNIVSLF